ncbi:linoleoyl-CoA desaturase [Pseudonocardia thermophila]|jgi:Fatty acid desaturase|uniref:Linoleoyl-CoA desaturase n=1 Tax=Pseudonocardia thermophila TaxID=1848 RepID=A0A1M6QIH6_PSETH|nr:acyl-CoA desaturase [Pseudonocardia thermophila]SHK19817.1 linoleoyl-CoA desaturase [Pseudonocardia thermophila]
MTLPKAATTLAPIALVGPGTHTTTAPSSSSEHLTPEQIEQIGKELDALRTEVMNSLGEKDAKYIRRVIATQRALEFGGRAVLLFARFPPAWLLGTAALSVAKILDNMEIGHNVLHGQWDWMRDPKIHSTTWEWDHATPAAAWKRTHNYEHHTFTNIRGKDRDLGYTVLRVTPEQEWKPIALIQPLTNLGLSLIFEWGIALYDLEFDRRAAGEMPEEEAKAQMAAFRRKALRQIAKDFVLYPALSGPRGFLATAAANLVANLVRNVWSHAVIFCGHFPEPTETFEESRLEGETRGEWYVRQMLGSANLSGGPIFHIMTGNLSHQIEHHCFPDMPSNRYRQIAPKVREICARYGLRYNTGPLPKQYFKVLKKIARLALPGGK